MAKFNVVQKQRRAQIADRKRAIHGDPFTKKLKKQTQPQSLSGKRKRKQLKKWRREQKEAIEKGLVTMHDVEMAAAEGSSQESKKTPAKFHLKKSVKLKSKHRKHKGKNQGKSLLAAVEAPSGDAMVE